MPHWAKVAVDPANGGLVEALDLKGRPLTELPRRGRVAPRQLFAFAAAKGMGWNPGGAADRVIDAAFAFLNGPGRAPGGGWAHEFGGDGKVSDPRRDLYDHTFVALGASQLAAIGDARGAALAEEAFAFIDSFFRDARHGGWHDPETAPGEKRANPHMHLLEASLLHYDATSAPATRDRISTIASLFERWIFDPELNAVREVFNEDWSRPEMLRVEPGHCYEWAYLLDEAARATGRRTESWSIRLLEFGEQEITSARFALDVLFPKCSPSYRLWPQLERLRALSRLAPVADAMRPVLQDIIEKYLSVDTPGAWTDQLSGQSAPIAQRIPASMIYHLMTALAPMAIPRPAS